jgi:hypothetical protein
MVQMTADREMKHNLAIFPAYASFGLKFSVRTGGFWQVGTSIDTPG